MGRRAGSSATGATFGGWSYVLEYVQCGKPGCRCTRSGAGAGGHGPYWYAYRHDVRTGRTVKRYVGRTFRRVAGDTPKRDASNGVVPGGNHAVP